MESISVLFSLFQFQLEIYANVTPGTAFLIEMKNNKGASTQTSMYQKRYTSLSIFNQLLF